MQNKQAHVNSADALIEQTIHVVKYLVSVNKYRIYSIKRLIKFLDLEAGRLLNFHHFQQVVSLFATKQ